MATLPLCVQAQQPPVTRDTLWATICFGDSVELVGEWIKTNTQDSIILPKSNQFNGDSVIYRNVQVWDTALVVYYDTVPEGTNKVWYSIKLGYLHPGDYTFNCNYPFTTIHGCDSTEVLHVHILPTTYIDTAVTLCQGETFTFDNITYSKQGNYTYRHHHEQQGDTVVTVDITVHPTYNIELKHTMPYGDSVKWQGGFITNVPGVYVLKDTSVSQFGCDSLTTLTLTVDKAQQQIIWNPSPMTVPIKDTVVLDAIATSGLPVTYLAMSPDYAIVVDSALIGVKRGLAMVEASQQGNAYYYSATSVRYMFMVIEGEVGWQDISIPSTAPRKVMLHDRLYIMRDERIYTIDGHVTALE